MTSYRCHQRNLTFSTIKNEADRGNRDKEHICYCLLFSLKKKCCWCTQNYLWDV